MLLNTGTNHPDTPFYYKKLSYGRETA